VDVAAATPVLPHADAVFGGASAQHLFLGLGAQAGVVAGSAAAAGLRSLPGTLERHFAVWSAAAFDPGRPAASASTVGEWALLDGYLKRHPTCAHLHGVNDAVEDLVARRRFEVREIVAVEVATYPAAAAFADPRPGNDLAARFSIPWTVAVGLVRGGLEGSGFEPEALADGSLQDLAARVRVRADPELAAGYPAGRPAVVTIHLRDGTTTAARAERPRGDGPSALADPEVRSKPLRLLEPRLGAAAAEALVSAVDRLAVDGLEPLTELLRARRPGRRGTTVGPGSGRS
jgi:2-methylcitrate dehydratase PrpD